MPISISDMPHPLASTMALGARVDAEAALIGPDDAVLWVNDGFRQRYALPSYDGATYSDIYWYTVTAGLVDEKILGMSPQDYLAVTRAAQRAHTTLDFTKRHADGTLLAHCHRVDDWMVLLRVPLDERFGGVPPRSIIECAELGRAPRPTAVELIHRDGRYWSNDDYGARALTEFEATDLDELVIATTATSGPIWRVVPRRRKPPMMVKGIAIAPGIVSITVPLDIEDELIRPALMGAGLTPGELSIAAAVANGFSAASLAAASDRAVGTINRQLATIYTKMRALWGVSSGPVLIRLIHQIAAVSAIQHQGKP